MRKSIVAADNISIKLVSPKKLRVCAIVGTNGSETPKN
ncbi:MAG: hypothetical protein ACJA11_000121 [Glaciecola sp.]|jgi:hypothetical protein